MTPLNYYNSIPDADLQDWASSSNPDPYDVFGTPGVLVPTVSLSPVDITVMNTLGWKAITASADSAASADSVTIPEPDSLLGYITLGGLMLGSAVRRFKSKP